ncbi:pre-mRNA-processing-splicing factor 8 [Ceratobasidium sp. AG-Ba]|nr:pre-mRNA-processing-splicing factor 8 [Ceratobasidium sp. AG-Ba]
MSTEMNVESALKTWESCRVALSSAIGAYVASCNDLHTACARSVQHLSGRQNLENLFALIDETLPDLAEEEARLLKARAKLSTTRNSSRSLTSIHTLPSEILSQVFTVLHNDAKDPTRSNNNPFGYSILGTSASWRQVAINTPALWTHIRIICDNHQTSYDRATVCLVRSGLLPLDIHAVIRTPFEQNETDWSQRLSQFLEKASFRIQMLDIEAQGNAAHMAREIMRIWMTSRPTIITKILSIRTYTLYHMRIAPVSTEWEANQPPFQYAEEALRSVTVLHLQEVTIPWASPVYHGLVDLRLAYNEDKSPIISASQLAIILCSSPELVNLTMVNVTIGRADSLGGRRTAHLHYLDQLTLIGTSCNNLDRLLALFSVSGSRNKLKVRFTHYRLGEQTDAIIRFLSTSFVKTLHCSSTDYSANALALLPMGKLLPYTENLVLEGFKPIFQFHLNALSSESGPNWSGMSSETGLLTRFPNLHIVSSGVTLESLKFIIRAYGIRFLRLERCSAASEPYDLNSWGPLLQQEFPDFDFVVTEEHLTSIGPPFERLVSLFA